MRPGGRQLENLCHLCRVARGLSIATKCRYGQRWFRLSPPTKLLGASVYSEPAMVIAGQSRRTTAVVPVVNPATEETIGNCPMASERDLADALEAAREGFAIAPC